MRHVCKTCRTRTWHGQLWINASKPLFQGLRLVFEQGGIVGRVRHDVFDVVPRFGKRNRFSKNGTVNRSGQSGTPGLRSSRPGIVSCRCQYLRTAQIIQNHIQVIRPQQYIGIDTVDFSMMIVGQTDFFGDIFGVAGITCIRPDAPTEDWAFMTKRDSCRISP